MGRHSLQNCPSQVPMGDLDPRLIHGSLGPQAHKSPRHKWHLDRFSRFCRVHSCDRPTDRLNLSSPLATTDMGRKLGAVPLLGVLGPHLTQCGLGQGLPPCQVSFYLIHSTISHNTPTSQTERTG